MLQIKENPLSKEVVHAVQLYPAAPYDPNAPKRPPRNERFPKEYKPPPTGHMTGEEHVAFTQSGSRQKKRVYEERQAGPMPGKKRRRNLDEVADPTGNSNSM